MGLLMRQSQIPAIRTADRVPISCPAYIREGNSFDTPARIVNLSTGGFKCEFLYPVGMGSEVALVIRDVGEFAAVICWKQGNGLGGQFLAPIGWRQLTAAKAAAKRRRD